MSLIPRIAILGGGPSGLLLARLLQVRGLAPTVFERDASPSARSQGGALDLHRDGGQLALKQAGLFDAFLAHARPEGETLRILNPQGQALWDESRGGPSDSSDADAAAADARPKGEFAERPEIQREDLRRILLDSLHPGRVVWDAKVRQVHEEPQQHPNLTGYTLSLDSGKTAGPFDLVVGAEGAWSAARPLLTDERPFYCGVGGLDLRFKDVDHRHPDIARRIGQGMCLQFGDRKGFMAQRNGDGSVRMYAFVREPEERYLDLANPGPPVENAREVKEKFVQRFYGEFSAELREQAMRSDDDEVYMRPVYMLPIGHTWKHKVGLTLVGDAAHLMAPFAGVGVNAAMQDSMDLANRIADRQKAGWSSAPQMQAALSEAVVGYEQAMFARAKTWAEQTWMYLNLFFHERGGQALVDHFNSENAREAEEEGQQQAAAA